MAANVIVDASFLVTLLSRRETNHRWAQSVMHLHPPPWNTCEAAISEAFYLLGPSKPLTALLGRGTIVFPFHFQEAIESVVRLMEKYASVPMSFADACMVRMTEILSDPILLTTDADFHIYRRHSRHVVPCLMPD
jgi:predicted nucleic acid-binding protein